MPAEPDYTIAQGDHGEEIARILEDSAGDPVSIEGATVRFLMSPIRGGTAITATATNGEDPGDADTTGLVSYRWEDTDTETPGVFLAQFEVTYDDGSIQTFPNGGYIVVRITKQAPLDEEETLTTYITVEELKRTLTLSGTQYADEDIESAIFAASRVIDHETGTTFYSQGDPDDDQVRFYTASRESQVKVDDLLVLSELAVDLTGSGTFEVWDLDTDFVLEPANAPTLEQPWTRIALPARTGRTFSAGSLVRVTGRFGWDQVPATIVQAATILSARLLKRAREAPFAVAGMGMDGMAVRIARTDPDLAVLLAPHDRHPILV